MDERTINMDEIPELSAGWREFARDFVPGMNRPEHCHREAQLLYAQKGVMLVRTPDCVRLIAPFQVLWIPAGVRHSISFLADTEMRSLYFSDDALRRLKHLNDRVRVLAATPLIRELFSALFSKDVPQATALLMTNLVLRLVSDARELGAALPMADDDVFGVLQSEILSRRLWNLTMEEASARLSLAPKTFSRRFHQALGMTWRDWMARARLCASLDLLLSGRTLKDAAFGAGYADQATFTAAFRKLFGTTPGAMQKSARRT